MEHLIFQTLKGDICSEVVMGVVFCILKADGNLSLTIALFFTMRCA